MQWKWKSAAASISISNDEELDNSGEGQLTSLMKAKMNQTLLSLQDEINQGFFASTQGAKAINCLPTLVDATSTKADISSSANSWWQSQITAGGSFAGRGLADWLTMYNNIAKQGVSGGIADIFLTTQAIMEYYERSQQPQMRYMIQGDNMPLANAGFESLKYKAATVINDPNCNSGVTYVLPSANLKFVVHSKAKFQVTDFVKPANQTAKVAQIVFRGNLVTNNRRKLGKITGISA